ncbi:MAG: TetR/AcrR family transcriptional regulator [Actinomycetota bacterium]
MSDREPLTRARVVGAAVALADDAGLTKLSMRKLGEAVGVEAMSLYHHVANKDDLLDGMVDHIYAQVPVPEGDDWRAAIRKRMLDLRSVLLQHRWAVGLLDSRTTPGPANLLHHDAVLGCFRRNGFPLPLAAHAYAVIDAYLYGFVLQELALPFEGTDETQEVAGEMLDREGMAAFPHLIEMATDHVMQPGYDFADEFEYGLELILDGLQRRLDET